MGLKSILPLGALLLAGCTGVQPTVVDQGRVSEIYSPTYSSTTLDDETTTWRLISQVDRRTNVVSHQLQVVKTYQSALRFYDTAADTLGNPLSVVADADSIFSLCVSCMGREKEDILVAAPDQILRSNIDNGYVIQLRAETGECLDIDLPPSQLRAQFRALDAQVTHS